MEGDGRGDTSNKPIPFLLCGCISPCASSPPPVFVAFRLTYATCKQSKRACSTTKQHKNNVTSHSPTNRHVISVPALPALGMWVPAKQTQHRTIYLGSRAWPRSKSVCGWPYTAGTNQAPIHEAVNALRRWQRRHRWVQCMALGIQR